jgi:SAM-dependent methyltransferase
MPENPTELEAIYRARFSDTASARAHVWDALAPWLVRHFPEPAERVLDLGCGYGEWINRIPARERHGMDLNAEAARHLIPEVRFHRQDCTASWPFAPGSLDAVVTSNFFEHLPSKDALRSTLEQCRSALRPGGCLIALGPNIRFLHGRYWDFIDHHVALSDRSLSEALGLAGFRVLHTVPRFMPYTLVDGPRYPAWMVRLYLSLPLAWPVFGRQFLIVAEAGVAGARP